MIDQKIPTLLGKEMLILDLLIACGEMYGLELVEQSEGRLKRGTVYVTLGRMEDKKYVESRTAAPSGTPGLPRRLYRATGFGARVEDAWVSVRQTLAFGSV
jgi:PadR family transcriptional regulator, regulatory protein PadR